jgi:hypothetical protein
MTDKTRIYIIAPRIVVVGSPQARLVRAATPAAALKHVTSELLVEVASQDDCIELAAAGVRVEQAGKGPEPEDREAEPVEAAAA